MNEIALDYLAWAIVTVFYLFGVVPMFGSQFDSYGDYLDHLRIGLTIHLVVGVAAGLIWAVLWALLRLLA